MNQIFALKRLEYIFASYPEIYEYLLSQITDSEDSHKNEELSKKEPEKLLISPWDYEGLDINKEFVELNEDILYWPELIKENSELKWLRKYYLDYLIRKKRLNEYDFLTEEIIAENIEAVDWVKLAQSTSISKVTPWNMDFVVKYWSQLTSRSNLIRGNSGRRGSYNFWANESIPWDRKTFELLKGRTEGYPSNQIHNRNIPWRQEEMLYFKEIGNNTLLGQGFWTNLSKNQQLEWDADLIEEFKDLWRWDILSANESINLEHLLLGKFKDIWSWGTLSKRQNNSWSSDLIRSFKEEWDWEALSENIHLPWSKNFIEEFEEWWVWEKLSLNQGVDINDSLLLTYEDRWNWENLSGNENVAWTEYFIYRHEKEINFKELTKNRRLTFTRKLILKFKDRWDWSVLSRKVSLPWTYDLIEDLEREIYWSFLTNNPGLPWSIHLIEKYASRWDWNNFYYNNFHGLPINLNFIQKFIHNIMETDIMSNSSCGSKFCDSVSEVFGGFISKKLVPYPKHPPLMLNYFFAEKAKQYLKIHKPLYLNEWIEVTLLKVLNDEVRSYNSGVRPYHYYRCVVSCTTIESIDLAHQLYSEGRYRESIEALDSFTIELEQDELNKVFIGQKFMVKSSDKKRICGSHNPHPVHYYHSLLEYKID